MNDRRRVLGKVSFANRVARALPLDMFEINYDFLRIILAKTQFVTGRMYSTKGVLSRSNLRVNTGKLIS